MLEIKRVIFLSFTALALLAIPASQPIAADEFPPGWLPISHLNEQPSWKDVRAFDDRIHLYLPTARQSVRGVFVCFVFHSSDPRELARLWNFALVTVPWPFEYDLGVNDKRNGRFKLGHPVGSMDLLLRYLAHAAKETKHPELATVPLVGWLGQNGSHLCADIYERAPDRVLAWCDSFPNRLRQFPELTKAVPFPFAWEISKAELRSKMRSPRQNEGPLDDLSCRANTYGFEHGIYSKYNFFMAYLDRCIRMRMPKEMPSPGEPVLLTPIVRNQGWIGDFDPIGEWNPIAPAGSPDAASAKYPVWLPDEYAAWMWRSYHSANPDLRLTDPVIEYSKHDGKWGGPQCGLGYGGYLSASTTLTFSANSTGNYSRVEFHDGDGVVGVAAASPWRVDDVRLQPGLRTLFAIGVKADCSRVASRPAFAIVE